MTKILTVGKLARLARVTTKTVRYYEAIGLLPPALRGENGYRYYPLEAVNRLSFIRRAKLLGLSLDEIKGLMGLSDDGACDVISPELHRVLERKVAECDRQLAEITAFRSTLVAAAERLSPCATAATVDTCTICSAYASDCNCLPESSDITFQMTP